MTLRFNITRSRYCLSSFLLFSLLNFYESFCMTLTRVSNTTAVGVSNTMDDKNEGWIFNSIIWTWWIRGWLMNEWIDRIFNGITYLSEIYDLEKNVEIIKKNIIKLLLKSLAPYTNMPKHMQNDLNLKKKILFRLCKKWQRMMMIHLVYERRNTLKHLSIIFFIALSCLDSLLLLLTRSLKGTIVK